MRRRRSRKPDSRTASAIRRGDKAKCDRVDAVVASEVGPSEGASNVLMIMTDDQGYGVSGTFGGVIPTPALERIAKSGLRYTQFNSTALCSPTRAALITGRNH